MTYAVFHLIRHPATLIYAIDRGKVAQFPQGHGPWAFLYEAADLPDLGPKEPACRIVLNGHGWCLVTDLPPLR